MITLIVDPEVLRKLKQAMPKTNKAELALQKYVDVLQRKLDQSLLHMNTNMFKFFKQFFVSTHDLELEIGQFVINGRKQYLHKWLSENNLALIHVDKVGLKGSDPSTVRLTELVKLQDAMDIRTLRMKKINDLDALLNDESLSDVDFFYRLFPDFATLTQAQLKQKYELCPIDTSSLHQFIVWLTHKANKMNDVERQLLARQARVIKRIADAGTGDLPMEINVSSFGRTYYRGINVQSVHGQLRRAMLGDCYCYDIRISVVSWKMGYARECYDAMNTQVPFDKVFETSLAYLQDKKAFRKAVMLDTFGKDCDWHEDVQLDVVKQALTALSFGARAYKHGWIDQSGKAFNPALVQIIKNFTHRSNFLNSAVMKEFIAEQEMLDKYIFKYHTDADKNLTKDAELQSASGRVSKAKIMAYLYQHAETDAMDVVRKELKKLGHEVLANVHDAIYIRNRLSAYDRENIEYKMQQKTDIETWKLDGEQIRAYVGISAQVKQDEDAHAAMIAAQEQLAVGYKSQFF